MSSGWLYIQNMLNRLPMYIQIASYQFVTTGIYVSVPLLGLVLFTRRWRERYGWACLETLALYPGLWALAWMLVRWGITEWSLLKIPIRWHPVSPFPEFNSPGIDILRLVLWIWLGIYCIQHLASVGRALRYRHLILLDSRPCDEETQEALIELLSADDKYAPQKLPQCVVSSIVEAPCVQIWPRKLIAFPERDYTSEERRELLRNLAEYLLNGTYAKLSDGGVVAINWYNPIHWLFWRVCGREIERANWADADAQRTDLQKIVFARAVQPLPVKSNRIPGGWQLRRPEPFEPLRKKPKIERWKIFAVLAGATSLLMLLAGPALSLREPTDVLAFMGTDWKLTDEGNWPALDERRAGAAFGAQALTMDRWTSRRSISHIVLHYLPEVPVESVYSGCESLRVRLTQAFGTPEEEPSGKLVWRAEDKEGRMARFTMEFRPGEAYYDDASEGGTAVHIFFEYQ